MYISDLIVSLTNFINDISIEYYNEEISQVINDAKQNKISMDDVAKEWEKLMKEVLVFVYKYIINYSTYI